MTTRRNLFTAVLLAALGACSVPSGAAHPEERPMSDQVERVNPEGMHSNPAFSQAVVVRGPVRSVIVGGQNAVDASGTIVGVGDVGAQARQVAQNLLTVLEAAGARPEHVVKWTIYLVDGQPIGPAMGGFQQVLGALPEPPVLSVLFVSGLAHPDFLLEVEAMAVVPEG